MGRPPDEEGERTLDGSVNSAALTQIDRSGTTIEYCTFTHLGGDGLGLLCQTIKTSVTANQFEDISGNGILVDGIQSYQDKAAANDYAPAGQSYASVADFISQNDSITSNIVHGCGVEFPDAAGILAGFCDNLTIASNVLYNLPASGIVDGRSLNSYDGESGGWNDEALGSEKLGAGTWSVCNIKNNEVFSVAQVMTDQGGIRASGCNWNFDSNNIGTTIESNYIVGVGPQNPVVQPLFAADNSFNGIYVDSGATGVSTIDNYISNVPGNAIFFHDDKANWQDDGQFQSAPALAPPSANENDGGLPLLTSSGQTASAVDELSFGNVFDGAPYTPK